MILLSLRSFLAFAIVVGALGCGSKSLAPATDASGPLGDGAARPADARPDTPPDAKVDAARFDAAADATAFDASACDCTIGADRVTRMSWDCYWHYYAGRAPPVSSGPIQCGGTLLTWSSFCGLVGSTWSTAGGPQRTFFDATGAEIGIQMSTDETEGEFGCTGGGLGGGVALEAGQVPSALCKSIVACTCTADGIVSCPPSDAGAP